MTTDARQRLISNVTPGVASHPGLVDPNTIVCVEPSPDVAVAVANSMGASAGIGGKGSFAVSGAQAEGLAQLAERTTAIQAILKQGYQGCIDYMNGAISATTYSLRQSRLDDLLVTLVLAEDASGAFGRSGASIGTNANAEASASSSILPISQGLQSGVNDLNTKQKELDTAQADLKTAQDNVTNLPSDATIQQQTDAKNDVIAKQKVVDQKTAERDAAQRSVTGLSEANTKAAAGVTQVAGQGGLIAHPSPEVARVIGQMQDTFVNKDIEQSYISTCLTELGLRKQRFLEDDRVRQSVANQIVDRGLTRDSSAPYYLSTNTGNETQLTQNCQQNLATVVLRAQTNSDQRKKLEMQLESDRLKAGVLAASQSSREVGEPVRLLDFYYAANTKFTALQAVYEKVKALKVPTAPKPGYDAPTLTKLNTRWQAALGTAQAMIAEAGETGATKLTETARADAATLDNTYARLKADPRSAGSDQDFDDWQRELGRQQQDARLAGSKFDDYGRRAEIATDELKAAAAEVDKAGK